MDGYKQHCDYRPIVGVYQKWYTRFRVTDA